MVNGPHTIIRLFSMCEAMKWSHLPSPGGLYDQHPDLLDGFMYIFAERSKYDREKQERERKEQERKSRSGGKIAGRRR